MTCTWSVERAVPRTPTSLLSKRGIGDTGYLPVRSELMRREAEVRGLKTPLVVSNKGKEMGPAALGPAKCLSLSL